LATPSARGSRPRHPGGRQYRLPRRPPRTTRAVVPRSRSAPRDFPACPPEPLRPPQRPCQASKRAHHRRPRARARPRDAQGHRPDRRGLARRWWRGDLLDRDDAVNINQRELATHVKRGIRAAGGTPVEFQHDRGLGRGLDGHEGMRASLVSREVIADSIELVARGHLLDGLVCWSAATRHPRAVMALGASTCRPVLYNGSIAPGRFRGATSRSRPSSRRSVPTPWGR